MLSWARPLSLISDLRRIQGHHGLSNADHSVAFYSKDAEPLSPQICRSLY